MEKQVWAYIHSVGGLKNPQQTEDKWCRKKFLILRKLVVLLQL